MGFIIGSLGAAWPWKTEDLDHHGQLIGYTRFLPTEIHFHFVLQILCIIIGVLTILIIDYYERRGKIRL